MFIKPTFVYTEARSFVFEKGEVSRLPHESPEVKRFEILASEGLTDRRLRGTLVIVEQIFLFKQTRRTNV